MFFYHLKKCRSLFIHDKESVRFHVQSEDYFGTLATLLSLWRQQGVWPETESRELEQDLLYLQKKYIIKKKLD